MRLAKIRIHNVLGIENLELLPGRVTRAHGRNGAGKSTIIKALQAVAKGGQQVKLVRDSKQESEPSEVHLLIEDDGAEISITKRLSDKSAAPTVKINGANQREPQRLIGMLMDTLAVNPIEFVNAKPADQIQWLLSAMPVTVTKADFESHGIDTQGWTIPQDVHGLLVMDQAYEWVYECRREANVAARKAKDSAERLRGSLPSGSDEELQAERAKLASERDAISGELAAYSAQKEATLQKAIVALQQDAEEARKEVAKDRAARDLEAAAKWQIVQDLEARLAEAKQEHAKAVAHAKATDLNLNTIDDLLDKEIKALRLDAATAVGTEVKLKARLQQNDVASASCAERLAAFQRSAGLRSEYDRAVKDEAASKAESTRLDQLLVRIQEMKRQMLAKFALPEVEIRGEQIWYEGHLLETQNEAKRVILALQVVAARVKMPITTPDGRQVQRLPLICLDGAECLDPETYSLIDDFAEAEGLQMIVTRVTADEKLVVTTN